jgi:hypothetical protein
MWWTALILGMGGSLHCAGMCGPLALALPHPARGVVGFVAGRLLYQAGRMTTYAVLGGVAGEIGRGLGGLGMAGVQRWVSVGAGVLILSGLMASVWAPQVAFLGRWIGRVKTWLGRWLKVRRMGALWVLGLLNGLLPCGLVYAGAAGAAATGGALAGTVYMLLFGLGTVPVMLGLGLSGRAFPMAWRLRMQALIPVVIALTGTLLVLRGMGLGIPWISPDMNGGNCCHVSVVR